MKTIYSFNGKPTPEGQDADLRTLKLLHQAYHRKIYLFARQFIPVAEEAEEVVDDVFLKVWEIRGQLANIENLASYLYIVARNHCLNHLRSKAHRKQQQVTPLQESFSITEWQTPEDFLVYQELSEELQQAIDQLPAQCRKVFKLVKEDGLKYKEVADLLDISVNTVDAHVVRAVKTLRLKLEQKFGVVYGKVIRMA